jgi:purine-binding chemotaxis protein CheW
METPTATANDLKGGVDQTQYLAFYLGGEEYAIGILQVKEIIEYGILTKIPGTPEFIQGVINLRGSVVPVVDLAIKFGLAESAKTKRTCIIVVEVNLNGGTTRMGVIADSVSQVMDFLAGDIEPPLTFGNRLIVDYLMGLGKVGKKFVLILDIDRVLSEKEILTAASSAQAAEALTGNLPVLEPTDPSGLWSDRSKGRKVGNE